MSSVVTPPDPGQAGDSTADRSAQPSIINLRSLPTSTLQEVDSDVLNPVVFSSDNKFCRFELEPKGFMSPGSAISIGVKHNSTIDRAFFPLNVGVMSLLDRAVLRTSSGRVISEIDAVGNFMSLKSLFVSNDHQKNREQYTTGRIMNFNFNYTDSNKASTYGLDNGKEYNDANSGVGGMWVHKHQLVSKDRALLTPTFLIYLHDLFPFLKAGNQLPLFMFGNDRIQVELYFTDPNSKDRLVLSKAHDGATGARFDIDQNNVHLISDHIFYPGMMEDYAEQNRSMTFSYFDYQLSRQTIVANKADATKDQARSNIRQLGGAGRLVTRAFAALQSSNTLGGVSNDDRSLLNKYNAFCPSRASDVNGVLTTNLFYNERFLFPQNVNNSARQFHNLQDAEQKIPYTTREVYSNEGRALVSTGNQYHFEGRGQDDNLEGHLFWQGYRLNRGERVGSKGIELTMNNETLANGIYTQVAFIEVLRYATLNDGHLEVAFA